MSEPLWLRGFAAEVEWEGGVTDALDYGLTHTDIKGHDQLAELWLQAERRYEDLDTVVGMIEFLLEAITDADDD